MVEIPGFWAGALAARVRPTDAAVRAAGGWAAIADAGAEGLIAVGVGAEAARRWASHPPGRTRGSYVTLDDAAYPDALRADPSAPPVLCYEGALGVLAGGVALVGTRACTAYGAGVARHLAAMLVARGCAVISGLALGIDSHAHRGGLARTAAVLGHGLGFTAPLQHTNLRAAILDHGGCVLTAFPDDVEPRPHTFPTRNDWIAGLARAVVVIEAPTRSGALLTATAAHRLDRPVYAVPGPVGAPTSRGCLELLRGEARVVVDVDELVSELVSGEARPSEGWQLALFAGRPVDTVAKLANKTTAELLADLGRLEIAGAVVRLPGGRYAPGSP